MYELFIKGVDGLATLRKEKDDRHSFTNDKTPGRARNHLGTDDKRLAAEDTRA
jgi:hypothetical protein